MTPEQLQLAIDHAQLHGDSKNVILQLVEEVHSLQSVIKALDIGIDAVIKDREYFIKELQAVKDHWENPMDGIFERDRPKGVK